jgi:sirohydrochlorin ferrochelatase
MGARGCRLRLPRNPVGLWIAFRAIALNPRQSYASAPACDHYNKPMPQPTTPGAFDAHTAIILVDHGSRREESNLLLDQVAALYRSFTRQDKPQNAWPIVEPAHMELASPSIADAFDKCVAQGATKVVVMPYFLSPGRHWFKDIPDLTTAAAQKHPGVSYLVAAPLGLHPLMASIIDARITHCINHTQGKAPECDICQGTGRCTMKTTPNT